MPELDGQNDPLWAEFLDLLGRYGVVERREGRTYFRQRYESESREIKFGPNDLRAVLTDEAPSAEAGGPPSSPRRLPVWFVDEVVEFVGSREAPYGSDRIELDGARLRS